MSITSAPRLFFIFCVLVTLPFALSACSATNAGYSPDNDEIVLDTSPPDNIIEEVTPITDPQGQIWRPGYWAWNLEGYHWVPGQIIPRPSPTATWFPAYWAHHTYGWTFEHGHWE